MPSIDNARQPFPEQIAAFRARLGRQLPTERWTDVMRNAHDRAFVVAGAQKAELLADFAAAVERAVTDGKSLGWFRQEFDAIVDRHGWAYRGERNWRSRVIYQTNLSTTYAAGRLAQLRDPALRQAAPYWMYRHSDSVLHPRPLHVSWDKLTLPAEHPWFRAHYPPNGWGCKCRVVAVSRRTAERLGGRITDEPPDDGTYQARGEEIPRGIDYGWDYMPGETWAQPLAAKTATLPPQLGVEWYAAAAPVIATQIAREYGRWLDEVFADPRPAGRSITLHAMEPEVLAFLLARGVKPERADITIDDRLVAGRKARRHRDAGSALSETEWRALPAQLAAGVAERYYDNDGGEVLYVLPSGEDGIRLAMRVNYLQKRVGVTNSVRSAAKIGLVALQDTRRYTRIGGSKG